MPPPPRLPPLGAGERIPRPPKNARNTLGREVGSAALFTEIHRSLGLGSSVLRRNPLPTPSPTAATAAAATAASDTRRNRLTVAQRHGLAPAPPPLPTSQDWLCALQAWLARHSWRHVPECPICLDPLHEREMALTSCSHAFHACCIACAETSAPRRCPLCSAQCWSLRISGPDAAPNTTIGQLLATADTTGIGADVLGLYGMRPGFAPSPWVAPAPALRLLHAGAVIHRAFVRWRMSRVRHGVACYVQNGSEEQTKRLGQAVMKVQVGMEAVRKVAEIENVEIDAAIALLRAADTKNRTFNTNTREMVVARAQVATLAAPPKIALTGIQSISWEERLEKAVENELTHECMICGEILCQLPLKPRISLSTLASAVILGCGHVFHHTCYRQYALQNCPVCRQVTTRSVGVDFQLTNSG